MGAWVVYALGSENEDLPSFVVLPDARAHPWGGTCSGRMASCRPQCKVPPFVPQAIRFPISQTRPPTDIAARRAGLEWLATMNRKFAEEHPGDSNLDARLRSYGLAAKMQLRCARDHRSAG